MSDISDEDEYIKNDSAMKFEELYLEVHVMIQEQRDAKFPVENTRTEDNHAVALNNSQSSFVHYNQFEKIPTPKFTGNFTDWPSFYDAFNKLIHSNENLTNTQRFHYLKKALPSNRDADIQHMLMTNENYNTAWKLLTERYNNARILFAHHMNSLYQLPIIQKEEANAIKTMLNAANVCINEFTRLKIPISQCDHWLAHCLSTKLPSDTHKAWERQLGNFAEIPTFKQFEEFLLKELFTMDAIENSSIAQNLSANMNVPRETKAQSKGHRSANKAHAFHTTTTAKQVQCVLCSAEHIIRRCPTFLSKDCYERKKYS